MAHPGGKPRGDIDWKGPTREASVRLLHTHPLHHGIASPSRPPSGAMVSPRSQAPFAPPPPPPTSNPSIHVRPRKKPLHQRRSDTPAAKIESAYEWKSLAKVWATRSGRTSVASAYTCSPERQTGRGFEEELCGGAGRGMNPNQVRRERNNYKNNFRVSAQRKLWLPSTGPRPHEKHPP